MNPMLAEGVSMTCRTESGSTEVIIENEDGKSFRVSPELANIILSADGTHRLDISDGLLKKLRSAKILRTRRYSRCGLTGLLTVLPIGSRAEKIKPFCRAASNILPAASMISLLIGIISLIVLKPDLFCSNFDYELVFPFAYFAILMLSLVLHEIGHLNAAISCGRKVSEMGIILQFGFLPGGAYVAYDPDENNTDFKGEFRISVAGFQMQILLIGLCLLGTALFPAVGFLLLLAALCNVFVILVNAMPAEGLDGFAAISAFLEVNDLSDRIKKTLRSKRRKEAIRNCGLSGKAVLAFMYISRLANVACVLIEFGCILFVFADIL